MARFGPETRAFKCYLFMYLFSQLNFLNTYYMPGIFLQVWVIGTLQVVSIPALTKLGETDIKQMTHILFINMSHVVKDKYRMVWKRPPSLIERRKSWFRLKIEDKGESTNWIKKKIYVVGSRDARGEKILDSIWKSAVNPKLLQLPHTAPFRVQTYCFF